MLLAIVKLFYCICGQKIILITIKHDFDRLKVKPRDKVKNLLYFFIYIEVYSVNMLYSSFEDVLMFRLPFKKYL